MSEYSDLLRNYIVEKERANVAKMAVYCGIPIKQVYLYMNGKTLPKTRGIAEQMSDYMHLTPIQKKQMMRAYDKAVIGSERYELYETINACMLQFPYGEKYFKNVDVTWDWEKKSKKNSCQAVGSEQDFNQMISDICLQESGVKGGKICMVLPQDVTFPLRYLTARAEVFSNVRIEQILFPSDLKKHPEKETENLVCFTELLAFYAAQMDYYSYYQYDRKDSHFYNLNVLPCMVLTTEAAVLFEPKDKKGILIRHKRTVEMLRKQFQKNKACCSPFIESIDSIMEEFETLEWKIEACLCKEGMARFKETVKENSNKVKIWLEKGKIQVYYLKKSVSDFSCNLYFICNEEKNIKWLLFYNGKYSLALKEPGLCALLYEYLQERIKEGELLKIEKDQFGSNDL